MYRYFLTDYFLKQFKVYGKKFLHLQQDVINCLQHFDLQSSQHLGKKLYKLRLKSTDIPKGKNKSFRLIIYLWHNQNLIVPITIYFKGDIQNLSDREIICHLNNIIIELKTKNIF